MTGTDTNALPRGTRIGRTALRVSDREEMTEFYRTVVGLSVQEQSPTRSVLGAGESPLLVLEADPDAAPRPDSSAGLFHVAFRVPSRGALGDALGRIREEWELRGATDHRVSEALYATDPEGNGVEIYRDYPAEEWPIADDGTVRIGNDRPDVDGIAAAANGEAQAPPRTDVGHLHVEVRSLEAFLDCYVDSLGFEVKTKLANGAFVSSGRYHHHVAANTWHQRTEPLRGRGLSWFEVVLPDADAVTALRQRLADSELTVSETADGFSVTDPEEIEVRFREEDATD